MTTVRSSRESAVRQALAADGIGRIVLGGRFGEQPRAMTYRLLGRFFEAGGRLIETAHSYADGAAESELGVWLADASDDVICITKVGHPPAGSSAVDVAAISDEIGRSAERLQRDALDLVMLHRDDARYTVAQLLEPLLLAKEAGSIVAIGVANWTAPRLREAMTVAGESGGLAAASAQLSYAIPQFPLWPGTVHAGSELIAVHSEYRLPLLAWSANARGFFAGRLSSDATTDLAARKSFYTRENLDRLGRCVAVAESIGSTPTAVALAWTLQQHEFVRPIIGPAKEAELDDALAAARIYRELPSL
ncbi:aldo/keto reductase [Nocardia sp. NPDC004085]